LYPQSNKKQEIKMKRITEEIRDAYKQLGIVDKDSLQDSPLSNLTVEERIRMMRGIIEDNRTQEYARKRAKERKQEEEKERDGERKRAELQKREEEWKQQSEQDELKRVEERKQKDAERATHNIKKADISNGTEFHNDDSWESWRDQ
jgi:hypothetical protein